MKKRFLGALVALSFIFSPVVLLAQTDGSTEPPPPVETPPAETPPPAEPTPTPATPAETPPAEPAPTPAPTTSPTPTKASPSPTPKPTIAQATTTSAPAPTQPPVSLDDVKEFVDTAAEYVPKSIAPLFAAIAGALAGIIAVLGFQKIVKTVKNRGTKKCANCQGTGREKNAAACATCGGTGQTDEDQDLSAACARCEGEGEEPCPVCKGAGEISGKPCTACDGTGIKKDEEGEPFDCSLCKGEGEVSTTVTTKVPCPDCK